MMKDNNFQSEIQFCTFGFIFSLFFTAVPFFLVCNNSLSKNIILMIVLVSSIIQIILHLKYFLHLNFSTQNYWQLVFLTFSLIIIFIIIFGSVWIMHNLNHHILCNMNLII